MADITTINAALDDNADWFALEDATKCAAWMKAATQLLHRPEESQRNGQGVGARQQFNLTELRAELKFARSWYRRNAPGASSYTGVDFTEFDSRR